MGILNVCIAILHSRVLVSRSDTQGSVLICSMKLLIVDVSSLMGGGGVNLITGDLTLPFKSFGVGKIFTILTICY